MGRRRLQNPRASVIPDGEDVARRKYRRDGRMNLAARWWCASQMASTSETIFCCGTSAKEHRRPRAAPITSATKIGASFRTSLFAILRRPATKHEDPIVAAPRIAEAHWQVTALRPTTCFITPWLMTAIRRFCEKSVFLKAATGFGRGCQRGKLASPPHVAKISAGRG